MKKIWIGILICMVVAGCSNDNAEQDKEDNQGETKNEAKAEQSDASSTKPYTFSVEGQSFEIVPMYDELLNYAAKMKEDPSDNKETFEETVIQPMQKKMTKIDLTSGQKGPKPFFRTTQQFDQLKDKTNQLADQQDRFNDLLEEALKQSAEKLPEDDVSVYLMPYMPEEDALLKELFAVTASGGNIMVKMSPSLTNKSLQSVIAHEYHHTVAKDYNTLLGKTLVEAKADYFANTLYPSRKKRTICQKKKRKIY